VNPPPDEEREDECNEGKENALIGRHDSASGISPARVRSITIKSG
jgi:hypothetical protein